MRRVLASPLPTRCCPVVRLTRTVSRVSTWEAVVGNALSPSGSQPFHRYLRHPRLLPTGDVRGRPFAVVEFEFVDDKFAGLEVPRTEWKKRECEVSFHSEVVVCESRFYAASWPSSQAGKRSTSRCSGSRGQTKKLLPPPSRHNSIVSRLYL